MADCDYKHGGWENKYFIYKREECPRCRSIGRERLYNACCMYCDGKGWIAANVDPAAVYFVLRLDEDPHARKAALAYAASVEAENPVFAMDIRVKVAAATPPETKE